MKNLALSLILLLASLPIGAQTRIKDIALTDAQANSDQWLITDDTSDNLTKKMTLSTLFGGWPGGVSLIGSPLTGETLTLKGSALNDGDVLINPSGGNVGLGTASPAVELDVVGAGTPPTPDARTVGRFTNAAAAGNFAAIAVVSGTSGSAEVEFGDTDDEDFARIGFDHSNGHYYFRTEAAGTKSVVIDGAAGANSLYIDSSGHIGLGADPTATNNFYVKSADTTFLSLTESTGTNAVVDFQLKNDAQTWGFQVDGGTSDRFELRDVTVANVPVVIETTPPSNSLYIDFSGDVMLGDSTSRIAGLTVRPGGDAGTVPAGVSTDDGIAVINTGFDFDNADLHLIAGGSTGFASLKLGDSNGASKSVIRYDAQLGQTQFLSSSNAYMVVDSGAPANTLHIDGVGEVGIGTATPQRDLHINDVLRIEPRSAAPAGPGLGDIYVDSDTNELCFYDGSSWTGLKAGGACV